MAAYLSDANLTIYYYDTCTIAFYSAKHIHT